MVAGTGVFLELAAAAVVQVEHEAEVLRGGLGSGFHLDEEVIALALGQCFFGDERAVFGFHRQGHLAGLRLGGDGDDLAGGGDELELGIIETAGDAAARTEYFNVTTLIETI